MHSLQILAEASRLGLVVIFNSIWQGALIAGVAWLILRAFSGANATTRYAVWFLALIAILIVPVATSFSHVSTETKMQPASTAAMNHDRKPAEHVATTAQHAAEPVAQGAPATSRFTLPSLPTFGFDVDIPTRVLAVLFGVWLLGALVILVRLTVGLLQLERLKHDSLPLDLAYRDEMPRWSGALKGERDVRICVSEEIEVPVAVGLFDSMVLLPAHLVQSLDPAEIDQISLHELGHLLRADDWTNAVQRIVSGLLFFNPAAWFVSRQLDVEREVACDDFVLGLTGAVRPYAFCLTKMAEITAWPHRPVPAPGVFATRKNISIRIERLLRTGRAIGSSIAPTTAGAVAAALLGIFLALRTMTPCIAFAVPAAAAAPPMRLGATAAPPMRLATEPPFEAEAKAVAQRSAQKPAVKATATTTKVEVIKVVEPAPKASTDGALKVAFENQKMQKEIAQSMQAMHAAQIGQVPSVPPANPVVHPPLAYNGSCTGCDFSHANLSGRDFSNRSLEGSNFEGTDLRNARFDHANLQGVNFKGADLRGATFTNANMEGCNLRDARMDGANFNDANLTGCDVNATSLSPDQARTFITSCTGCDFRGVNLRNMNLRGIHAEGLNMRGADLRGADLTGASFTGVDFTDAKFNGAKVDNANFQGCDFHRADLRNVDMSKANFTGADMANAIWR